MRARRVGVRVGLFAVVLMVSLDYWYETGPSDDLCEGFAWDGGVL